MTHIAEVAGPVLGTLVSKSKVDTNFEVFLSDDLRRTRLIYFFWLAIDEEWERCGTIDWYEGDVDAGRIERDGEGNRSGRGKDATPAAKVQCQYSDGT